MILKVSDYNSNLSDHADILIYKGQQIQAKIEREFGQNNPSVVISSSRGILADFITTPADARRCLEDVEKALVYDKLTNPEMFL